MKGKASYFSYGFWTLTKSGTLADVALSFF